MSTDLLSATEIAKEFLSKSGYPFSRLEKSEFDEHSHRWKLTFDVSLSLPKLKTVTVDDKTGGVVSFE